MAVFRRLGDENHPWLPNGDLRPILLKNSVNRFSSGFSSHQRLGECVALDFYPAKNYLRRLSAPTFL